MSLESKRASPDPLYRLDGIDYLQEGQPLRRARQLESPASPTLGGDNPASCECLQDLGQIPHRRRGGPGNLTGGPGLLGMLSQKDDRPQRVFSGLRDHGCGITNSEQIWLSTRICHAAAYNRELAGTVCQMHSDIVPRKACRDRSEERSRLTAQVVTALALSPPQHQAAEGQHCEGDGFGDNCHGHRACRTTSAPVRQTGSDHFSLQPDPVSDLGSPILLRGMDHHQDSGTNCLRRSA